TRRDPGASAMTAPQTGSTVPLVPGPPPASDSLCTTALGTVEGLSYRPPTRFRVSHARPVRAPPHGDPGARDGTGAGPPAARAGRWQARRWRCAGADDGRRGS